MGKRSRDVEEQCKKRSSYSHHGGLLKGQSPSLLYNSIGEDISRNHIYTNMTWTIPIGIWKIYFQDII